MAHFLDETFFSPPIQLKNRRSRVAYEPGTTYVVTAADDDLR